MFNIVWDNLSQAAQFYIELKDEVKNNIVRRDQLTTLEEMINIVIYINNRMYKQYLKKWSINTLVVIKRNNR